MRSDPRPRPRRPLATIRLLVDVALLGILVVGLSGVVLGRVLPALGHPVLVVAGPSMEPAVGVGTAVVLETVPPTALRVGDVVSLRTGPARAIFTHRITRIVERDGAIWLGTKGDANADPDPSISPASAVLGRVAWAVPGAGYALTVLSAPAGVLFVLSTGALLLSIGWWLDSIARERRSGARARPGHAGPAVTATVTPAPPAPAAALVFAAASTPAPARAARVVLPVSFAGTALMATGSGVLARAAASFVPPAPAQPALPAPAAPEVETRADPGPTRARTTKPRSTKPRTTKPRTTRARPASARLGTATPRRA